MILYEKHGDAAACPAVFQPAAIRAAGLNKINILHRAVAAGYRYAKEDSCRTHGGEVQFFLNVGGKIWLDCLERTASGELRTNS